MPPLLIFGSRRISLLIRRLGESCSGFETDSRIEIHFLKTSTGIVYVLWKTYFSRHDRAEAPERIRRQTNHVGTRRITDQSKVERPYAKTNRRMPTALSSRFLRPYIAAFQSLVVTPEDGEWNFSRYSSLS